MIELLMWILIGCVLGIFTGMIPGIHVNTIALISLLVFSNGNLFIVTMITAMAIVHTFVDFIPSIFLGAPDTESFLSVLPGHEMLLKGEGIKAVKLTVFGGILTGLLCCLSVPFFLIFVSKIFETLKTIIPFFLGFVIITIFLVEKRKFSALITIVLSALLGILVLRESFISNSLFALVTGFFGVSTIIASVEQNPIIPEQKNSEYKLDSFKIIETTFISFVGGSIVALMPGIGSGQAAVMISKFIGKMKKESFLLILGGINTANMLMSFVVMLAIGKTRTGAAAVIKQLIKIEQKHIYLFIGIAMISIFVGSFSTIKIAKFFGKKIHKLPYKKINYSLIFSLSILVLCFSGLIGFMCFTSATGIGLFAILSKVKRINCMSFLIMPTILFYLGL